MKRICRQIVFAVLCVMICGLLSGCTIGEYHIFDTYEDEDGEQHFMGFGEIGPRGGENG